MSSTITVLLIICLCLLFEGDTRADHLGNKEEQNIMSENLLKAADIFKTAQVTLKENVLALQQVFSNFNSLMGTMQSFSQSLTLSVREIEESFVQHASGVNGNICVLNLSQPLDAVCDRETNQHREAFLSQLKSIWHTLQSSERSLSAIKNDDIFIRDCWDIYKTGNRKSGMYRIWPKLWRFIGSFYVYCELEDYNGGWTVIHRRQSTEDNNSFKRSWNEYMFGFGDVNKDFWLGNEKICVLSQQKEYQLLVTVWDRQNASRWAKYNVFHVAQKNQLFKLHVGEYTGNAGDIMAVFNGRAFSTEDSDYSFKHCARKFSSGWWFHDCSAYADLPMPVTSLNAFAGLLLNKDMLSVSCLEIKIKPMHK